MTYSSWGFGVDESHSYRFIDNSNLNYNMHLSSVFLSCTYPSLLHPGVTFYTIPCHCHCHCHCHCGGRRQRSRLYHYYDSGTVTSTYRQAAVICADQHCIVLYCIVLCCIVLYCIVLCVVLSSTQTVPLGFVFVFPASKVSSDFVQSHHYCHPWV